MNDQNTMTFSREKDDLNVRSILEAVYQALLDKGYDPVNQIVGYIISGDPTYITGYNNARNLIRKVERDELLEELVRYYIQKDCE